MLPIFHILLLPIIFSQSFSNYINFETLDVGNGLSQNYVNCIFEDHLGFIWIGTDDGLNKYNGIEFVKYFSDTKIKESISGNQITCIAEDKNNNLWISTRKNGLNKLNSHRNLFTKYFNTPSKPNYCPNITNLQFDGNDQIWFLSKNTIHSFHTTNEKLQKIELDVDSTFTIAKFTVLNKNRILISSNKNKFLIYDSKNNKISKTYCINNHASITTFLLIENKIIIGTFEGDLFVFNVDTEQYTPIFKSVVLSQNSRFTSGKDSSTIVFTALDICTDNENKILISGRESLISLELSANNGRCQNIKSKIYDFEFAGNCITTDKSGNVWIGTNGKGIRIYNEKIKKFQKNYNIKNFQDITKIKSIRSISENADYMFIGGYYGLVFVNKTTYEITDFPALIKKYYPKTFFMPKGMKFTPAVYALLPDPDKPDDILWIGVEGYCSGLYRYHLKSKELKHFAMNGNADDFMANFVFDICADNDGILWLANDYGAYKFNRKTEEFTFFQNQKNNPNSIQKGRISTIHSDNNNVLWFGSVEDGVSFFDQNSEQFVHLRKNENSQNSLPSNSILSIFQDHNSYYWFSTVGSGLSRYDYATNTFKNYTINDGLPNNVIYGVQEDNDGNIWISTNNGISKLNTRTETFTNYSTSDGLTNIEYNTGAYYKDTNGALFFGGINGFDYFNPNEISPNPYEPPIVLTSVKIQDTIIESDSVLSQLKQIELSYRDNLLTIEFAALSYFQASENEYAYMLEGLYSEWIPIGTENSITLSGLKSGHYTLKIKASNNDAVWNEAGLELPIIVHPPFWESWWFVAFLIFASIVFVLIILRLRQIRFIRKEKELELIISERTLKIELQKEELQANTLNLEKALKKVKELVQTKDNISSMLVHDLKNPLNSIINYATLLQKTEKKDFHEIIDKTKGIEKSAFELLCLVENLLDIAKMEDAKMQITITANSLNTAVNEALSQVEYLMTEKQLKFDNKINIGIEAEFDHKLIVRVLVNLLTNAIKFSENNSKISIDYEIIGNSVKIKIIDFGVGIPEQYLDSVFDKFVQSEMRKLGITQSTGLGLTFSKLAILAHDQQIGVVSHINKGSTFWFGLKLVKTSDNIIPKKIKRKIIQTNDEITTIKKELKNLKYYETGEIFTVLSNKDFSSNEFLKWKQDVEKAALLSNEAYYNDLIKEP